MKTLLDHGANPHAQTTVDHLTPLMATFTPAAPGRAGRGGAGPPNIAAVVRLLLDKGANVNAVNSRNMTAAHYAAPTGNDEALKLLVERGASLEVKDRLGRTPSTWPSES